MKMLEINDYLVTNNGIFKTIYTNNTSLFEWLTATSCDVIDMEYYLNHSGNKTISPLTYRLYENDDATYLTNLANIIVNKFKDKWLKLYDALIKKTYNPIENYSMVEDENVQTDIHNSSNIENNVFGFNTTSTDGVPNQKNGSSMDTTGEFDKNHRKLTRSGNIGVTTSQQMIESSAVLLNKWNFYDIIMGDVDSVMCLAYRGV